VQNNIENNESIEISIIRQAAQRAEAGRETEICFPSRLSRQMSASFTDQSLIAIAVIVLGAPDMSARLILFAIDIAPLSARDRTVFTRLVLFDLDPTLLSFETNRFAGGQFTRSHTLADAVLLILLSVCNSRCPQSSFLRETGHRKAEQQPGHGQTCKYFLPH
jgi:hypothetical protein